MLLGKELQWHIRNGSKWPWAAPPSSAWARGGGGAAAGRGRYATAGTGENKTALEPDGPVPAKLGARARSSGRPARGQARRGRRKHVRGRREPLQACSSATARPPHDPLPTSKAAQSRGQARPARTSQRQSLVGTGGRQVDVRVRGPANSPGERTPASCLGPRILTGSAAKALVWTPPLGTGVLAAAFPACHHPCHRGH